MDFSLKILLAITGISLALLSVIMGYKFGYQNAMRNTYFEQKTAIVQSTEIVQSTDLNNKLSKSIKIKDLQIPTSSQNNILYPIHPDYSLDDLPWTDYYLVDLYWTVSSTPQDSTGNLITSKPRSPMSQDLSIANDKKLAAFVSDEGFLYLVSNTGEIKPIITSDNTNVKYTMNIYLSSWSPSSTRIVYQVRPWVDESMVGLGYCYLKKCSPTTQLVSPPTGFLYGIYVVDTEKGELRWLDFPVPTYEFAYFAWLNNDILIVYYGNKVYEYNFLDNTFFPSQRFGEMESNFIFRYFGLINNEPVWSISEYRQDTHSGTNRLFFGTGENKREIASGDWASWQSIVFLEEEKKLLICPYYVNNFTSCNDKQEYNILTHQLISIK